MKTLRNAIMLILFLAISFMLTACYYDINAVQTLEGNSWNAEGHHIYPLLFNTPEIASITLYSPYPNFHFHLNLTDEQLKAVFPKLDFDAIQIFNAEAFYAREGTLVEVVIRFGNFSRDKISIGVGGQPNTIFTDYSFVSGFVPGQSNVHGIPVTAYMLQESDDNTIFRTFFTINDESFYIYFPLSTPADGQAQMTEIVNMLILGGTDGLVTLAR